MITLENKKYIKKELIILTISMIILLSIIYFCYFILIIGLLQKISLGKC